MRGLAILGGLSLALTLLPGCGGSSGKLPAVEGRVFFRGAPVPGGTIVFSPDPERGGSGPLAWSVIQPDGHYVLRTGDQLGASVGWHRVTILPSSDPARPLPFALPRKYADAQYSERSYEIKGDARNLIDVYLD